MIRPAILSALALAACGPRPVPAQLVRTCTPTVLVYQKGQARWLSLLNGRHIPIEAGADLDSICEGYRR